jgi:hypothetical protein
MFALHQILGCWVFAFNTYLSIFWCSCFLMRNQQSSDFLKIYVFALAAFNYFDLWFLAISLWFFFELILLEHWQSSRLYKYLNTFGTFLVIISSAVFSVISPPYLLSPPPFFSDDTSFRFFAIATQIPRHALFYFNYYFSDGVFSFIYLQVQWV